MKNYIINSIYYLNKLVKRDSQKKKSISNSSVHFRRDLDALGEYIKI